MLLLSFTVRNHKSIRDEIVLDLKRPSLRGLLPREGESWESSVYPLAGIFGANATGKSTVLDAFLYAFAAINQSSTAWQARKRMVRAPFRLDGRSEDDASKYELDFVSHGTRYTYGFEVDARGVRREWLRDVPSSRWRSLINRDRDLGELKIHSSIRGMGPVAERELLLSRAYVLDHEQLGPVAADLMSSFDHATVKDSYREQRLDSIAEALMEGAITFDDIVALLQVADIGVEAVTVEEKDLPKKFAAALRTFREALNGESKEDSKSGDADDAQPRAVDGDSEALEEDESAAVVRSLLFTHRGQGDGIKPFTIGSESDGTVAWLALMVPAIEAIRDGGLYCVDEIDSSLHPHLLEVVLGLFADPALNPKNAQLIFTSHETYILSPLSDVTLAPEQVWFADKSYEGVTELSRLSDYPRHKDANVAKRYLLGRYGGTPRLAPSSLAYLVDRSEA